MMATQRCPTDCPQIPDAPNGRSAEHRFVEANGLRFHTVQLGSGPPVLLLHGFPEFWYSWRRQLPTLGAHYRTVAPDLRGYNLTDRPTRGYDLPNLVRDVVELIGALGVERVSLVGHDWGGVIAWFLAMWAPERVERLAILNAPHPATYFRELRRDWRQRRRSWYVLYFQIPALPERLLSRDGCRPIADLFRNTTVVPGTFSEADLEIYRQVFCQPGALSAALAYYRALGRAGFRNVERNIRPIQAPTLLIWGQQDVALVPELASGLEPWVPNLRVQRIPTAGHWVHQEQPDQVNQALLEFLSQPLPARS
jgi:pimeloyl-ACP methyl ester carboxylesterase